MKLPLPWLLFCLVIALALFARTWQLSTIPPALDWDEVAIGWNAYSIWETRLDEYGTRLPLTFRSFGDYKAPILVYGTAPFVGLLGLEPWIVRLPSALAGVATVIVMFFLALEVGKLLLLEEKFRKYFALLATMLLALSPWHLLFSRPAFEPNIALFFITLGTWLFLLSLRTPYLWLFSGLSYLISLYAYHSPKVFLPPFLLGLLLIFYKQVSAGIGKYKLTSVFALIILIFATVPLIKINFEGGGSTRVTGTSIFYDEHQQLKSLNSDMMVMLGNNYLSHLNPQFFLSSSSNNYRMALKDYGLMTGIEWLFMIVGFVFLFKKRQNKGAQFLLLWFVFGFLPAMIGREVPHSLRSLNVLPAIILITAYSFIKLSRQLLNLLDQKNIKFNKLNFLKRSKNIILYVFFTFVFLAFSWSKINYFKEYYVAYPVYAARDWQYGYQQAIEIAQQYENQVDKIIITSAYGQPHIFTYFFEKREPMSVLWGAMIKYLFRDIKWQEDYSLKNSLLIGTAEEIPSSIPNDMGTLVGEVCFPDGTVAFRAVKTN